MNLKVLGAIFAIVFFFLLILKVLGHAIYHRVEYLAQETRFSENVSEITARVERDPLIVIDGEITRPGGFLPKKSNFISREYEYSGNSLIYIDVVFVNQNEQARLKNTKADLSVAGKANNKTQSLDVFGQKIERDQNNQTVAEINLYPVQFSNEANVEYKLKLVGEICDPDLVCENYFGEIQLKPVESSEQKFLLFHQ